MRANDKSTVAVHNVASSLASSILTHKPALAYNVTCIPNIIFSLPLVVPGVVVQLFGGIPSGG